MKRIALGFLFLVASGCGTGNNSTNSLKAEAGNVVEFHIKAGNSANPWNTKATAVQVKVGDTLRIYNDDSVGHRLHTNGRPCGHGDEIAPGKYGDCVIASSFDPNQDGYLYDHNYSPSTKFWVNATE